MTQLLPVSYLFVPGTRADRFEKAIASGADRVIIDLEDAVDASEKITARQLVCDALTSGLSAPVLIRLNSFDSPWFPDDLAALGAVMRTHPQGFAGFVLPKLETDAALDRVRDAFGDLSGLEAIGLIESAAAVHSVETLAAAGVTRLALGAVDLSVDLGSDVQSPLLDSIYARVVLASRLAGISGPVGSPPLDFRDTAGVETAARRLKSMGVTGQLCIHPAQIDPVHTGFAPTSDDVEWAQKVLVSVGASVQVEGQMVDKPVRDRAERIITLAARRNS